MSSILYSNSKFYEALLQVFHVGSWDKRYQLMADLVGKNKKVLDVGSGTGILSKFLDQSCKYTGIEQNTKFVNFAKKRNLNIIYGNIFDINFPKSDVVVISDILHHVIPNHEKLIEKSLKSAPVLVICEPNHQEGFFNFIGKSKLFFKIFGDNDGINTFEDMNKWDYSKVAFKKLFEKFGRVEIYEVGNSFIGKVIKL